MTLEQRKKRILVIEDDPAVRGSLQRYMGVSGYDVILARSGDEGLRLLATTTPDLLFLDLSLPGADGLAILRVLHEKYESLRVVMLADAPDLQKANIALNCGASDFIMKPIDLGALKRILQVHLPK